MVYKDFAQLIEAAKKKPRKVRIAVAAAGDPHTIEAVLKAREEGIASPMMCRTRLMLPARRSHWYGKVQRISS